MEFYPDFVSQALIAYDTYSWTCHVSRNEAELQAAHFTSFLLRSAEKDVSLQTWDRVSSNKQRAPDH